jgi:CDP-glycerol:poly(glycerophosphate) glycerophosphotransferase
MNPVSTILSALSKHLYAYDIGSNYDPVHSFADLLMRHLYSRYYQKESRNVRRWVNGQYRGAAALFYLRLAARKLRLGTIPIRIIFLAQDPLDWQSLDSLYSECARDPRFKTYVINTKFTFDDDYSTDSASYLRAHNIPYLDGIRHDVRLDLLNPDIVAVSSPYDDHRTHHYRIENLLRYAKLVYVPYAMDFADQQGVMARQTYGLATQRHAWRIFSRSPRTRAHYRTHGRIPPRRIVCLGHPKLDHFYSASGNDPDLDRIASASVGKTKIIYAPHHTLDGWSTFLPYAEHIRNLIRHDDTTYLVMRPHPLLLTRLRGSGLMSADAYRELFTGHNCCIYEGDNVHALFRWSDLLLSDASSFLIEYAPTHRPIIYLHRAAGWGIDDSLREEVAGSCYVANSKDEIGALIAQVKNGCDPLRGERERHQERMSVGIFSGQAGKRIAAYLARALA